MKAYVHGYSAEESTRLKDQAETLAELIHFDSTWEAGTLILEAGCGVGAQTRTVAPQNPECRFVSIDISQESVNQASEMALKQGIKNVQFQQGDIFHLDFDDEIFDHILVCFVLEHLANPVMALEKLMKVLKPGGTIMLIEGDHGSTYFHPDSKEAQKAIRCQVDLQRQNGGDANIGRKLYPLMTAAGLQQVKVSPRQVYVDDSNPELVEGFTKNTFTAMIKGIAEDAIHQNLITRQEMEKGISDLYQTTKGGGTFCYTFFKGIGRKVA